jgi:hypothetical protein
MKTPPTLTVFVTPAPRFVKISKSNQSSGRGGGGLSGESDTYGSSGRGQSGIGSGTGDDAFGVSYCFRGRQTCKY